jgi:hypothetical protein
MLFRLNLHVIANLLFFTGASRHSDNTDMTEELVSSTHSVHVEAEAPSGIFNEHILFKYVYFDRKIIYTF